MSETGDKGVDIDRMIKHDKTQLPLFLFYLSLYTSFTVMSSMSERRESVNVPLEQCRVRAPQLTGLLHTHTYGESH